MKNNHSGIDLDEVNGAQHFVQFYEEEVFFLDTLESFIRKGLNSDETCIVCATNDHITSLNERLRAHGIDVQSATDSRQYVALDAGETLARFMVEKTPDPDAFVDVIKGIIAGAAGRNGIRIFGEMVVLLWNEGNTAGALRLEQLWNDLREKLTFRLFCAYPISCFDGEMLSEQLALACGEHTRVIPTESYTTLPTENDRLRLVAGLQQKARSLSKEVAVRKRTEDQLRASEIGYRRLFEASSDGILIIESETHNITDANPAIVTLTGLSCEDLLGRKPWEVGLFADRDATLAAFDELREKKNVHYQRLTLELRNGQNRDVEIVGNIYSANSRNVIQLNVRDLTERKVAEELNLHLAAIVETSSDAIISKSLDGIILSWNKGAERIFGYTADEVKGKSILILIPPDRVDEEPEILRRLRQGEIIDHYETVRVTKDGKSIDISLTVSAIKNSTGKVIAASKIARDITEAKRAESILREQAEVIETINRIGRMLSAELNLDKVLQAVTEAATELTGAQFGSFFYNVPDERGKSCTLYTLSRVPQEAVVYFQTLRNTNIFNQRFAIEGTLLLSDARLDPRYGRNSPYFGKSGPILPVSSYLAVPVISRSGEVLGGLFFGHSDPSVFFEKHARVVEGLAAQTAISIDNARLFKAIGIERTKAQEALERNSTILESITDAFFAVDREWRFTHLNKQAEKLLFRSRDELLGKSIWNEFPEFADSTFDGQYRKAIDEQTTVVFEEFYSPLTAWFEVRAYPSREGLSVYFQDITERRRAADALLERTRLAELSADIGLALTGDSNLRDILQHCSIAMIERLGIVFACIWTLNEHEPVLDLQASAGCSTMLTSQHVRIKLGQFKIGRIAQDRKAFLTNDVSRDPEMGDHVLDVGEPQVSFAGYPLLIESKLVGVIGMYSHKEFTPATFQAVGTIANGIALGIERKSVEVERAKLLTSERAARSEAEAASRSKDEFLSTLSHELRTPLTAMLGWSRMLKGGQLDEETKKQALEAIDRNACAQQQLIEDILDMSRVISGKMQLKVQTVDLDVVVAAAVDAVLPGARAKEIRVQRILDSGSCMVPGDPMRLQQVVWNLLSNAVKFTPKGGRIRVTLERVNSHVEIEVRDTGQGVSADVLPFVFDRFRQADSSTTRSHGGLGLGLSIVRHLVELHGGTVEAKSEGDGMGATFTVKLPLLAIRSESLIQSQEERAHPTRNGDAPFAMSTELGGLHILVVDDDEDTRTLVSLVLESCGAKVTPVTSTTEGIVALQSERPDVILSDLGMPEEDGYSFIARVRALPPDEGGHTPAAALTAFARVEDRMKVLNSGFQIHISKPVEPAELVTMVANLAKFTC